MEERIMIRKLEEAELENVSGGIIMEYAVQPFDEEAKQLHSILSENIQYLNRLSLEKKFFYISKFYVVCSHVMDVWGMKNPLNFNWTLTEKKAKEIALKLGYSTTVHRGYYFYKKEDL